MKNNKLLRTSFHNKSGYKITVDYNELGDSHSIHVKYKRHCYVPSEGVYEGYYDDHIVSYCVKNFDFLVKFIKDKTARRYFLRLVRNLPMHELKVKDFLTAGGDRVDWNKVHEYENKYN